MTASQMRPILHCTRILVAYSTSVKIIKIEEGCGDDSVVAEDCRMLSIHLAVPSCFNSIWHGVIPTSFFIFNDFYTHFSQQCISVCNDTVSKQRRSYTLPPLRLYTERARSFVRPARVLLIIGHAH